MSIAAATPVGRVAVAWAPGASAIVLGLSVAPVLASNGGYFPTSWGWAGMGLAWMAVIVAAISAVARPTKLQLTFVGALTAFALWQVLELAWWSMSPTGTGLDIERTLVYVAAALAVMTCVGPKHVRLLLGSLGIGAGAICLYALATRLFPGATSTEFGGYRLERPIGYWNGLGLLTGMATILALVFAARSRRWFVQATSAGALPLLLPTLYFTFSRGAWGSVFAGLLVLVVFDRERLQLIYAAVPALVVSAYAVWRSSHYSALTHTTSALTAARSDGRHLALVLVVCCAISAGATVFVRLTEPLWLGSRLARGLATTIVAAAVVIGAVAVFNRFGSPVTIVRHSYASFVSGNSTPGTSLNSRLFTLRNNGRLTAWRVALHAFEAHPVNGIGSGSFEVYWNKHRAVDLKIRDAHSLYVEKLGENGLVGFGFLVVALIAPLVAFRRVRRLEPLAAGALAAYVTYLVGTGADWDWELSGVTLVGLFSAAALLSAVPREGSDVSTRWRFLPLGLGSVVALVALVGLVGDVAVNQSARALGSGNFTQAASDARRAQPWLFWSAQPWQQLGEAQAAMGQKHAAEASFRSAISKNPRDWHLWIDLGGVTSGRVQGDALARAALLNPLDTDVQALEAQILAKTHASKGR